MRLQQNKVEKVGITSALSSIVIECFRTHLLFFSQILKRKNTYPTLNKAKKKRIAH